MRKARKIWLGAAILAGVAGIFVTTQSVTVRNIFYALNYERTLDRYSTSDTTTTAITRSVDDSGRSASLLSAFFGLDDGLPRLADRVICDGSAGQDGMPVIFSHEVDVATLDPGDFKVTRASGEAGAVTCLTLAPADDPGERRTVLLAGALGSADDQPAVVEIVGNILSLDRQVNFKGTRVAVTPLEDGPDLVWAERVPETQWAIGTRATGIPFGGGSGCPSGTRQIIRVTWAGGVTKPGGDAADEEEAQRYQVRLQSGDDQGAVIAPNALADVGDGDNNHKLCLETTDRVVSVSFPAGLLTDPREDLNPATSIPVFKSAAE